MLHFRGVGYIFPPFFCFQVRYLELALTVSPSTTSPGSSSKVAMARVASPMDEAKGMNTTWQCCKSYKNALSYQENPRNTSVKTYQTYHHILHAFHYSEDNFDVQGKYSLTHLYNIDLTLPLESTDIYFPGVSKISVFSSLHAKVQSHTIVTFIATKHSPKTAAVGPLIVTYIMCSALGLKSNTCICFV